MEKQASCEERIDKELESTIEDLTTLWKLYQTGDEDGDPDLGHFCEYGLSFDYVPPHTFKGQKKGYFRYQISWGGPSDEFRFFVNPDLSLYKVRYHFMDWFDGAKRTLTGDTYNLLAEIFDFFSEVGSVEAELQRAMDY